MLRDLAEQYSIADYNCAESMVLAANDYYHLGLDVHSLRVIGGFGGGLQCGDVCGGLTGAICIISARYITQRAHEDREGLKAKVNLLVKRFEEKMGARTCHELKPMYHMEGMGCRKTIKMAADVLEEVISEIDSQLNA